MGKSVKHRFYASFMVAGSGFLFARTIVMMAQGNLVTMVIWAAGLLLIESLVDAAWLYASLRWLFTPRKVSAALRLGAAAIVLHAIRVTVYFIGRVGPWVDFDRRPDFRTGPPDGLFWVYFPAAMAALSVLAVIVIWRVRKHIGNQP
jgi:hypothetical protein